ncbi:sensor histidine kinase N-terminal domain-containing protein [Pseudoduganella sp. RAF19]|uniref:sensor histidine kinase n=1 Tax=Pseudoduganella sp. RAF19 TaxID=3233052 RepID=UPI003F95B259
MSEEKASWQQAPAAEANEIQHSLFGEILDWMLAPLLLLWPMSIAITYLVAKSIANQPFDHALEDNVTVLSQQVREVDGQVIERLSGSARDILRADDVDSVYFQIMDPRGNHVDGDRDLPQPQAAPDPDSFRAGSVNFRNDTLHGTPIRVAYSYVNLEKDKDHDPRLALVQVAETLEKRAKLANEIIKGVILPQFIILPIVLALVWFALSRGLLPLAELQERIRARPEDDLSPIPPNQVPEEITPLVRSLNEMLERLKLSIDMQKRFIADAAHQMKTPLAGMRMQSELALRQTDRNEIHRSLEQLAKSSEAATRLVNQLLALARTENQPQSGAAFVPIELGELARTTVQDWVQASFNYKIDLGFEPPTEQVPVSGNPMMLREMLSNLIDNALRYTPRGGAVTVRVRRAGDHAILEVEDNGPGIPPAERAHVFERFYRILGSTAEGSGLGLAIVREVAQQHNAELDLFSNPRCHDPKYPGCLFRLTFEIRPPEPIENDEVPHFG